MRPYIGRRSDFGPGFASPFCRRGRSVGHTLDRYSCDECHKPVTRETSDHMLTDEDEFATLCDTCADMFYDMWRLARLVRAD